jgi:hypothetical protein
VNGRAHINSTAQPRLELAHAHANAQLAWPTRLFSPSPKRFPAGLSRRATHCSDPVATVPMTPRPYPVQGEKQIFPYPFSPISVTRSALRYAVRCRRRCRRRPPLLAVLLGPRTAAVWSASSSRCPPKEALKPPATSSPSAAGSATSWSAFSVHSPTPPSHPRAPPDRRGARPPLQAHSRPPKARFTVVPPWSPRVAVGSRLW